MNRPGTWRIAVSEAAAWTARRFLTAGATRIVPQPACAFPTEAELDEGPASGRWTSQGVPRAGDGHQARS